MSSLPAFDPAELNRFLAGGIQAAREAGAVQRAAFGGELNVNEALDHDIKLQLDEDCQALITKTLLALFPTHTVFGEEGGTDYGTSDYQWIVDPIDGTVNFFYNFPHFCCAIALQYKQETILGVTLDPIRDELFTVIRGSKPQLNGREVQCSNRTLLKDAMVSTGFAKSKENVNQSMEFVQYYGENARKLRMNGCAALDMAYIACGRLDGYIERTIRLWDIAGGALMVQEAGGIVDLKPHGKPLAYKMVASNGKVPLLPWRD